MSALDRTDNPLGSPATRVLCRPWRNVPTARRGAWHLAGVVLAGALAVAGCQTARPP